MSFLACIKGCLSVLYYLSVCSSVKFLIWWDDMTDLKKRCLIICIYPNFGHQLFFIFPNVRAPRLLIPAVILRILVQNFFGSWGTGITHCCSEVIDSGTTTEICSAWNYVEQDIWIKFKNTQTKQLSQNTKQDELLCHPTPSGSSALSLHGNITMDTNLSTAALDGTIRGAQHQVYCCWGWFSC